MSDHSNAYKERFERLMVERYEKVEALREAGKNPFANGFEVTHTAGAIFGEYGNAERDALDAAAVEVKVAGRIRFFRKMGKAAFVKIQDRTCRPGVKPAHGDFEPQDDFLQIFVSKSEVGDDSFSDIKKLYDLGDWVGVEGTLMRTRTGELSVLAKSFTLLTKSIRPLPDKFAGLSDTEQRLRQRYVDLVMNESVRETFFARSLIVKRVREFLEERGFLEVETPMMHVTPGGAAARPFVTHHNSLDMDLYLRIAPELYLKRLLVGGLGRVYELNRNFRNEGLSRKHNPEFTMLEFYQAYATYEDLMDLTEELIVSLARELHGESDDGRITFETEGQEIDVTPPWRRVSMAGAVASALGVDEAQCRDEAFLTEQLKAAGYEAEDLAVMDWGKLLMTLFEEKVEDTLIQPTFLTDFPASTSPLARRKESDPTLVDRFELFILGREIANAFSELNDPEDQYGRFAAQLEAREAGDDEAMPMDEDYVRALEYGMPPAAGEGIGIDRLVMLLTGTDTIRDVIFFPHLRPE